MVDSKGMGKKKNRQTDNHQKKIDLAMHIIVR